jgi:hypothetical protein
MTKLVICAPVLGLALMLPKRRDASGVQSSAEWRVIWPVMGRSARRLAASLVTMKPINPMRRRPVRRPRLHPSEIVVFARRFREAEDDKCRRTVERLAAER